MQKNLNIKYFKLNKKKNMYNTNINQKIVAINLVKIGKI